MNNAGEGSMQPVSVSDIAEEFEALSIIYWMTLGEVRNEMRPNSKDMGSSCTDMG